jgi:hypothetical protein
MVEILYHSLIYFITVKDICKIDKKEVKAQIDIL